MAYHPLASALAPPAPAPPKQAIDELAILGGDPLSADELHVGSPNIGDRERFLERIGAILDSRRLTNGGPFLREFEGSIANLVGVRHCVATCNGTIALEILARALGLTGEVIVPACTFVATAHALEWQGLTPVFADIDPRTHTLDPADAERRITPRTSALLGVHLWGEVCDTEALADVARRNDLALFYDASHALACSRHGRMAGSFGAAEVLSFHATKFLNAFEGGAIVTDDDALAERVRAMRNFGFAGMDCVETLGTNAKMTEISAAMGVTSLESMGAFMAANARHHATYAREIDGVDGATVLPVEPSERRNHQYVVLTVDESRTRLSRDRLLAVLHAENILARRYFHPGVHRMEPYRSRRDGAPPGDLPVTDRLLSQVVTLPTGTSMTPAEVESVARLVKLVLTHGAEITRRLERAGVPQVLEPGRLPSR